MIDNEIYERSKDIDVRNRLQVTVDNPNHMVGKRFAHYEKWNMYAKTIR